MYKIPEMEGIWEEANGESQVHPGADESLAVCARGGWGSCEAGRTMDSEGRASSWGITWPDLALGMDVGRTAGSWESRWEMRAACTGRVWCRQRSGLPGGSGIRERTSEVSGGTCGSLVCACGRMVVPFTGNTGRGLGLPARVTELIRDVILLRFLWNSYGQSSGRQVARWVGPS